MKIVRIITRLNIGGPSRQALLLSEKLAPPKYESVLIHGSTTPDEGCMTPKPGPCRVYHVPQLRNSFNPLHLIPAFIRIYRILGKERPDIVHTHQAHAGLLGRTAARLRGVPRIIHTFHGHTFHSYFSPLKEKTIIRAEQMLASISTDIAAISPAISHDLSQTYRICPKEKIRLIPLGFNLTPFLECGISQPQARKKLGLPETGPIIGFSGRFVPVKDPMLFLAAAQQILSEIPEARVLMCGDGPLRPRVEKEVLNLGLEQRVHFTGWKEEVEKVLRAMDVFVLTSRNEGTPAAIIEAMAAEVPVVGADVGGVRDLITDGSTGHLVTSRNPLNVAQAIHRALEDTSEKSAMIQRAKEKAAEYSAENLVTNIKTLYQGPL